MAPRMSLDAAHDDDHQRLQREDDAERGIEGQEHAEQRAAGRAHRTAQCKSQRRSARHIDADKPCRRRIDRHRAQRQPGAGVVQPHVEPRAQHGRAKERRDAIERVGLAEDPERLRQIGVGEKLTAEHRQQDADRHEAQAEGREDRIDLELSLALCPPDQRQHHEAVDRPVGDERERHDADQRQQRAQLEGGEKPDRGERAADQRLAARQIHDAGDAVLQLQTHRHQRVGAAEQQADNEDVHRGMSQMPIRRRFGPVPDRATYAQPVFRRTGL